MVKCSKKQELDRITQHEPYSEEKPTNDSESDFMNNSIASLPNNGNKSTVSQLLEINYEDLYDVGFEYLQVMSEISIQSMTDSVINH